MNTYELYRCIREDGTSKDWAVRINPDGTITTRWGRTGRKLINIQTRRIDLESLRRSKLNKGYTLVGRYEIDVLGRIDSEGQRDTSHNVSADPRPIRWQLSLGSGIDSVDLSHWKDAAIQRLKLNGLDVDAHQLPALDRSGMGEIVCDDIGLLLALLLLKRNTPSGVSFTLRTQDNLEIEGDLHAVSIDLTPLGTDLASLRPLAESLGLLAPRIDLRLAILSDRHCWF